MKMPTDTNSESVRKLSNSECLEVPSAAVDESKEEPRPSIKDLKVLIVNGKDVRLKDNRMLAQASECVIAR